jgi:hypothetical protein
MGDDAALANTLIASPVPERGRRPNLFIVGEIAPRSRRAKSAVEAEAALAGGSAAIKASWRALGEMTR